MLIMPELASRGNQEFVHTNFQVVFGSSEVEAVDLCGEGDCRIDQKPIVVSCKTCSDIGTMSI